MNVEELLAVEPPPSRKTEVFASLAGTEEEARSVLPMLSLYHPSLKSIIEGGQRQSRLRNLISISEIDVASVMKLFVDGIFMFGSSERAIEYGEKEIEPSEQPPSGDAEELNKEGETGGAIQVVDNDQLSMSTTPVNLLASQVATCDGATGNVPPSSSTNGRIGVKAITKGVAVSFPPVDYQGSTHQAESAVDVSKCLDDVGDFSVQTDDVVSTGEHALASISIQTDELPIQTDDPPVATKTDSELLQMLRDLDFEEAVLDL